MSRHRFRPDARVRGLWACACGVQCMVVVRLAGTTATLRAFNLYRHPLLTAATKSPNGLMRAKGWSTWSTMQPAHATARARTKGRR